MERLLDKERLEKIKHFIEEMKKSIGKYLTDVTDDLSNMPAEQYVQMVCDGNISAGSAYECDFKNRNYFSEVNEEKDIIMSDYQSRCKKFTLQRLLKEKDALVDVCIPEGTDFVKFAVPCPFKGTPMCNIRSFRWVKGYEEKEKEEKKDWQKKYDLEG